jgi:hypothetical protein
MESLSGVEVEQEEGEKTTKPRSPSVIAGDALVAFG